MSAPGATPAYVPLRLAIAPATQVGWSPPPLPYDSEPVVLKDRTTCPLMSPVLRTFWYSTTATRIPLPWSPAPLVQFAPTVGPALDICVSHVPSRPMLIT